MIEYSTIEHALDELRAGRLIMCTDDPERENEGDLICAAQFATTENINFMATHAKGLICMPMNDEYIAKLALPQMVARNTDNHETAFTVSIDHVDTTTGISAAERSITAMKCVDPDAQPQDFRRPGTCSPCSPKRAACSSAMDTPKRPSICAASPALSSAACAAKSCATTAP